MHDRTMPKEYDRGGNSNFFFNLDDLNSSYLFYFVVPYVFTLGFTYVMWHLRGFKGLHKVYLRG
jgi:hypothetical protein